MVKFMYEMDSNEEAALNRLIDEVLAPLNDPVGANGRIIPSLHRGLRDGQYFHELDQYGQFMEELFQMGDEWVIDLYLRNIGQDAERGEAILIANWL